jgi:MFS transporter, PPP family, 3-phenylpropionic acid transporter
MIRFSVHYFMLFTVMATVFPFFQVFLRALGFSIAEAGHLQGIASLAGVCGPVSIGYLADRLGRRKTLLVASIVVYALFLTPLGHTHAFIPAALLVVGVGFASRALIPLTDALAAGELPDPAHNYGRVRVWGSLGFVAISGLLGWQWLGLIDQSDSASMLRCMLVAAALCLTSAMFLPDRHCATPRGEPRPRSTGHFDWVFWVFLVAAAMHQFAMFGYYSFFTLYLKDVLGRNDAGWIWAIGSAAEIPMLFFAGSIILRFGLASMLMVSMFAVSVRLAIYATTPSLALVIPTQLLHALTFGLYHAASIEFLRRRAPAERRGLAMALYMSLAIGLPGCISSSLGGEIVERFGFATMYGIYAMVPLIGLILILCIARRISAPFSPTESA